LPLPAPRTWTFTTAPPPTVTATAPANGAPNVARNAKPTLTFSKPMDPATLGGITRAGPGATIATTSSYDAPTQTVTLTPAALLSVSTTYTIGADVTVKASDGSALAAPFVATFTTTADGIAPTATITSGPPG